MSSRDQLTLEAVRAFDPRYIFFLHWSWKVPDEMIAAYECVCFHMTEVPYGRGGSPLQNLILREHRHTKLTALQMTQEIDAGPIYLQRDLSLDGRAEEIYLRANYLAAEMIQRMIAEHPTPTPQKGETVVFKRRQPEESEISETASLEALYDFIRMLDAEGYPKAFLIHKGFRYEFSRSALHHDRILADVTIIPSDKAGKQK